MGGETWHGSRFLGHRDLLELVFIFRKDMREQDHPEDERFQEMCHHHLYKGFQVRWQVKGEPRRAQHLVSVPRLLLAPHHHLGNVIYAMIEGEVEPLSGQRTPWRYPARRYMHPRASSVSLLGYQLLMSTSPFGGAPSG